MKTSLLIYDIPSAVKVQNPTRTLRRIGFRPNQSCWVLRSDDVPWLYLDELKHRGVIWHCVPFAVEAGEVLCRMAVEYLTKDVQRLQANLKRSISSAEKAYSEGEDLHRYQKRTRAALKRAETALEDARRAARNFGVELDSQSPGACLDALRADNERKIAAYAEAMASVEVPLIDGVPGYVLADVLEEEGKSDEADAVREAFTEEVLCD